MVQATAAEVVPRGLRIQRPQQICFQCGIQYSDFGVRFSRRPLQKRHHSTHCDAAKRAPVHTFDHKPGERASWTERGPTAGTDVPAESGNSAWPVAEKRNSNYGRPFYTWDMTIRKGFYLLKEERLRLDFSVQFQNLLNRENFNNISN